ncbi:hypothetical protein [Vibrio sp.]|uniref:hypothetical protein n=1 Tax=Vibrio sp. TaxID=678 RepID=UPI003D134902
MEFNLILPCQPMWVCGAFANLFAIVFCIGLVLSTVMLYRDCVCAPRSRRDR